MSELLTDPQERHLKYAPPPYTPDSFWREFKIIIRDTMPVDRPMLRFVWGPDVTEQLGEYIVHRYPDPDGKYVGTPNWVLEGWQSPDVYDRNQWDEAVLGPWPADGVWDYIAVVPGQHRPLGGKALQMVREWRHWRSKDKPRVIEDLVKQRAALQVLKERRWEDHKEEILDDFVRDYSRAERGGFDPRRRTTIAKIDEKGAYQQTEAGLLIPSRL